MLFVSGFRLPREKQTKIPALRRGGCLLLTTYYSLLPERLSRVSVARVPEHESVDAEIFPSSYFGSYVFVSICYFGAAFVDIGYAEVLNPGPDFALEAETLKFFYPGA